VRGDWIGCILCLASYIWCVGAVVVCCCVLGGLGFSIKIV